MGREGEEKGRKGKKRGRKWKRRRRKGKRRGRKGKRRGRKGKRRGRKRKEKGKKRGRKGRERGINACTSTYFQHNLLKRHNKTHGFSDCPLYLYLFFVPRLRRLKEGELRAFAGLSLGGSQEEDEGLTPDRRSLPLNHVIICQEIRYIGEKVSGPSRFACMASKLQHHRTLQGLKGPEFCNNFHSLFSYYDKKTLILSFYSISFLFSTILPSSALVRNLSSLRSFCFLSFL
jgi:hypothetical protein